MNTVKTASKINKSNQTFGGKSAFNKYEGASTKSTPVFNGFSVVNATEVQEYDIAQACRGHYPLLSSTFAYYDKESKSWKHDEVGVLRPADLKRRLGYIGIRARVTKDKITVL